MKTKTISLFILSAILLTTLATAEVLESNYMFDGNTGKELVGVSAIMYTCLDESCDTATRLWQNTMNTGNDNLIVLTYPTVLVSEFGYMTYFFKPGYVPTKVPADWAGKGNAGEYDNKLYKITDTAYAPVEEFEVDDKTAKINQEITITANVLSPRINSADVKFIPEELVENYYSDKVKVSLLIDNKVVETKNLNMFWDTEQEVKFTFTPEAEGDYAVQIITKITDNKFLNTEADETQKITIKVSKDEIPEPNGDDDEDDKENKYPSGYKNLNPEDTAEDEQYLNQFKSITLSDNEIIKQKLSLWQRFINWFNNLFYKIFWFLEE